MTRLLLFSASGLALLAVPALAQTLPDARAPRPDAAADPADLPPSADIVVTATRVPTPASRVAAAVTVLDKAAIDRAQDIGVSELLLRTPGVSGARNGGYGTVTALRIRGAETDQTVVVIDGVKLNDPSAPGGGYDLANLLVGDAARIEVLRGPQSILWGSQAIGGVVNVVTAAPERPLEGTFDVETGSRETISARAALGGKAGPLTLRVGAQAFSTAGISAIAPAYGGTETDGYVNQSVTGRAELTLADGVSLELRGYFSNARAEHDGFAGDSDDYTLNREFVGYGGLNVDLLGGRLRNRFAYGYTSIKRDDYSPSDAQPLTFGALGRNARLEYQGSLAVARGWNAVFGVENERARFRTVSPFAAPDPTVATARAELTGVYGQLDATIVDGLTLSGGVRNDDHSRYGGKTLFQGGGVWALATGTTLRARYGEGFKAPTLYQLFSEYGNQTLEPEQASGWEAGAEQRLMGGALAIGATYFERRSRNLIAFASCDPGSTTPLCFRPGTATARFGYYDNIVRAFAQGVEAVAQVRVGRLLVDGNYTWSPSEDRSPGTATYGLQLARRPRHAANASFGYSLPHAVALGAAFRWSGETFDDAAHAVRLAPYALVDLRGEVPFTTRVAIFARVENVLDKQYQTALRYGTLGRSVYLGFRGRF